jgi:hypothetical protein
MNVYCLLHEKVIEGRIECNNHYFAGSTYHGMGMHNSCLTCKHKLLFGSMEELKTVLENRKKKS